MDNKKLKKISKELNASSVMHKKQAYANMWASKQQGKGKC